MRSINKFGILFCFFLTLFTFNFSYSQSTDNVLFTVGDADVMVDEFKYIYEKNNGDSADYSEESINEYLDLYTKFKLKVEKAKEQKLDTIVALQKELAGYRTQLASSYLVDKELSAELVDQAYQRMQKDVHVYHILFLINPKAIKQEQEKLLKNVNIAISKLRQGASFEMMAKTISDDTGSGSQGGDLGWLTAMLPEGFYNFENAIYSLETNAISDPIRSDLGYHIIKVVDTRPARGEMSISQILVRNKMKGKVVVDAKQKIDSLYILLKNGADFPELAKENSDDNFSASKGGYLGYFGIGQYQENFENAAFSLASDGDFSEPVESAIGWHIIKRIEKRDLQDEQKIKRRLQSKVTKDKRNAIAKEVHLEKVRTESGFKEFPSILTKFTSKLDSSFYTHRWEIPQLQKATLFSFKNAKTSINSFAEFCNKNVRIRLRFDKSTPYAEAVELLYILFRNNKTIEYEETHLESKYPEFRSLMREYSEGILLFEITNQEVWEKASQDTVGLKKFYKSHKNDYYWKERGVLNTYKIYSKEEKVIDEVLTIIKRSTPEDVLHFFGNNKRMVEYSQHTYNVGAKEFLNLDWKKGADYVDSKMSEKYTFIKNIADILPSRPKSFDEAKGYIIADYQEELENKWITQLRKEFPVVINTNVLNSLVQK